MTNRTNFYGSASSPFSSIPSLSRDGISKLRPLKNPFNGVILSPSGINSAKNLTTHILRPFAPLRVRLLNFLNNLKLCYFYISVIRPDGHQFLIGRIIRLTSCLLFGLLIVLFLSTGCSSTSLRLPPDEEARLDKEIKTILEGASKNDTSVESIVSELGFIWPLQGAILANGGIEGINIKAYEGQPVKATKSGIVTFVSDNMTGYGKTITIKHSDGFISIYAYNSENLVKIDQIVKQGDIIAKAGKTGRATQTQLQFRLFKNETPVNPLNYLP